MASDVSATTSASQLTSQLCPFEYKAVLSDGGILAMKTGYHPYIK
jgi:hypothetical protein